MAQKYLQIFLPLPFDKPFTYRLPEGSEDIEIGNFVTVPFGKKELKGVVWEAGESAINPEKIKDITAVSDISPLDTNMRKFIRWVAGYSLSPLGSVLSMTLSAPTALDPPKARALASMEKESFILDHNIEIQLSDEQSSAAEALIQNVKSDSYSTTLLDGITGSGKTEVYFEAVKEAIINGKQTLIMLPEIALTAQLLDRFEKCFGFKATEWHSALTPAKRRNNWRMIAEGKAPVVIGARSALFLPYKNLGLIVVDEEHDSSFKQEVGVIYHGRDMAVARANIEKIPIILSSASPALETIYNVDKGKFSRLHLSKRHGGAVLPEIHLVDMRLEKLDSQHWLSGKLKEALALNLERKEQSLLYLNRRGYAPLTLCRACGYRFQCQDCTVWLAEHRPKYRAPYLQCHHCGHTKRIPKACPDCEAEDKFASCGPGVERLEEEVQEAFPDATTALLASDNTRNFKEIKKILESIQKDEIDIIIGTQMAAKGHHFPNLTLVGVIDADLGLEGGDLRAAERSFQLLHQVSGRAGREKLKGRAILQSYMPENMVMQTLKSSDRKAFIENELKRRERGHMPPFSRLAGIIVSDKNEELARKTASELAQVAPYTKEIRVLGPAPAPLSLLRGQFRYRLLMLADRNVNIQKAVKSWLEKLEIPRSVKVKTDIDPQSFM